MSVSGLEELAEDVGHSDACEQSHVTMIPQPRLNWSSIRRSVPLQIGHPDHSAVHAETVPAWTELEDVVVSLVDVRRFDVAAIEADL